MSTLFISDLHLEESRPEIAAIFFRLLQHEALKADALYILGDFFETWIGDDDNTPFHQSIKKALKIASQQTPIYIMHGNRDFLLGKKFMRETGCQLIADEVVLDLNGTRALLMHGDSLCTLDKKYQSFRRKARNPIYQFLFLLQSLKRRKKTAQNIRQASRTHVSTSANHIMDVDPKAVEKLLQKHNVHLLIHGHTHRPGIHHKLVGKQVNTRIVLGAWHYNGNMLLWEANTKPALTALV